MVVRIRLISACAICVLMALMTIPAAAAGTPKAASRHAEVLANNTWYFAEGTTRDGFDEWITLQNPGGEGARVTITFMMSDGYNLDKIVDVPGFSRATVSVRDAIGSDRDVSTRITSDRPVVAERPLYFNYNGVWNGGDCAVGANATSTEWYFAEGTTRSGFDEYLCVQNPGDAPAGLYIEYMTSSKVNYFQTASAPPRSRVTLRVSDTVPAGEDVAAKLTSTLPVVAERPTYFNFNGVIPGGDNVVGVNAPQNNWLFAEGYTAPNSWTYLCIQNPGKKVATARVYYLLKSGEVLFNEFKIGVTSRTTVDPRLDIGEAEFSMVVASDQPVVAERVMYFIYKDTWAGGHDVMGAIAPGTEAYLAEGSTTEGFDEWVCMMNPYDDPAHVEFDIQTENSGPMKAGFTIKPHSRYTVNLNDTVGNNRNLSIKVTSDVQVVVERPMYFNYKGAWQGGSCVVAYTP
jgi:hypothetical protein